MIDEDNSSYVPKYVQLQNYILQKIAEGVYSVGDRIPSETELSRQFDISRITVNTAIKELAGSGVLERIQGKGTFVRSAGKETRQQSMAFASGIKIVPFEKSVHKPHKLIEHGIVQADSVLCAKLNLEQGAYVYKIVRCVCVDDQKNELDFSYIPLPVCSNHTFDSKALEQVFLHDYVYKYFNEKPTHIRIFINTQYTEDMDLTPLHIDNKREMFTWDTYVYRGEKVLAITTTVGESRTNKPFISLEF